MRPFHKNTFAVSVCGVFLLVIAGSVAIFQVLRANAVSEGLLGVSITAKSPFTIEAGGNIRLTAEGDYGTTTMPVRADWSIGSGVPATIGRCSNTQQCTVTAGAVAGVIQITARTDGFDAVVLLEVTETLKNPFTDALPDWAAPSIIRLHRAGIVKGYDDGRYGSGDPVTRGQVVTLLYRMLKSAGLIETGRNGCGAYADVLPGEYMEEAVCAFAAKGWGFDSTKFLPNDAASRGVVAKLVAMVGEPLLKEADIDAESLADGPQIFDDVPPGDSFFADVAIANALGVMTGYPSGDFGVRDSINRASMAVILDRLLAKFNDAGLMKQSPMQNAASAQPDAAKDSSSSALSSTAAVTAACVIQADNVTTPTADRSDFGDGYAKITYTDKHDLSSIRAKCTDELFKKIMDTYCSEPVNASRKAQWGVLLYAADGSVKTGGGAASGSNYHLCPDRRSAAQSSVSVSSVASPAKKNPELTAKTGTFNLSAFVNYYDFSKEAAVPFPYEPPYDIRVEKPGPLANQTKVWVYNGEGWISRIDPALQRSYPNVRQDDCIRQLKETRRFDSPQIGAGDTVCIDTDDGYIVKMTRHWSGEFMEYQRWPGEIDYLGTNTTAVSPTLTAVSSAPVSSSSSSASSAFSSSSSDDGFPPLPGEPSGRVRGSGTIELSYYSWTTFDFDAEKVNAPVTDYDVMFPHRNATFEVDVASVYSADKLKNVVRTKIMRSPRPYKETTEAGCIVELRKAQGYSAIVPDYNGAVCFQTLSGLVGKVSSGWPYGNVQYEIWGAGWDFLPEYQPGESTY
ncbi:hypothetical protein A3A67_02950 [Candidatus Peribacteria bacterium RIFCSPLOWO2_01_FULL_51_18]|nr:MAG: hypothetical protein A3C52_00810 [Candidatus Peribacteria bacterium RIFCSPHIGHO2_02_FULL_51_15]OGJ66005.1 MAG: hypothetical protein A3A67_02950 [Candidatus Peribacteria bacterium RIFCSPLOWO2_01_FULL_51_18]OGJ69211.1 MAG: hypothetical protein A3J34_01445 [Candidatus Peribacteria bacterium RIFCSPLOWO2_02_FULL_51_10]